MIQRKTLPTQLHTGKRPQRNRFREARNYEGQGSGYMKPIGGLWTSTYETAFEEGWPGWVIQENFHIEQLEDAWVLEPVECNVIELAGFDQCHEFMVRYGKQMYDMPNYPQIGDYGLDPDRPYARAQEHFKAPSLVCPVWEEVAADADCVRLLTPYAFNVRLGPYLFFNTWDCESTVWLRWRFAGAARRVNLDKEGVT